ncbi:uncharacterized protein LOC143285313 [Babylonia areolata]|uniref:uncharacterized protein LOC143285313 n=1 Tax=Babylonia areolata TaxID=304850 RepID=UPI003FD43A8E
MAESVSARRVVSAVCCILLTLIEGTAAGEYCWTSDGLDYCHYGCCGSLPQYCCSINVGLIIGCVVGGIICVAVVVTVVCCILKKQGYRGRVVGPNAMGPPRGGNNVTVVHGELRALSRKTHGHGFIWGPVTHVGMREERCNRGGFAEPAAPGYLPTAVGP